MAGQGKILRALGVLPGEERRIAWLSLHSLAVGIFIAFYFSATNALFLARWSAAALPAAYIVSGAAGYLTVALFSRLERRLSTVLLAKVQLGFLAALTTVLWGAAVVSGERWTAFALFVAITPAFSLLNLELWGLAGRLLDLRQSKRLFGLLGCGEVVSALLGYLLVPLILHFLDDPLILLPIAVAGLASCLPIVRVLGSMMRGLPGSELPARPAVRAAVSRRRLAAVLRSRYFLLIAGLTSLAVIANYLVDWSFLSQVRARFQGGEQVAAFIAVFFGVVKVIELTLKVLAGRLLSQFGLRSGLAALPATLLLCVTGAALTGTFAGRAAGLFFLLVAVAKLVWLVLRKSLFDPALRVLFQPLPEAERLAVQTRIEGLVQQLSTCLAGLLLLALARGGPAGTLWLTYLLIPLLAGWLALLGALHREYRTRLLRNLTGVAEAVAVPETPPVRATAPQALRDLLEIAAPAALPADIDTSSPAPSNLDSGLWARDTGVRRRALLAASRMPAGNLLPRILDHLAKPSLCAAAASAAAAQGESAFPHLEEAFGRAGTADLRVQILRIYERIGGPRAQAFLLEQLEFPDRAVQLQALISLTVTGYCAAPGQHAPVKRRIEDLAELTAWATAALLDLASEPACAATRESLDKDLQGYRRTLYRFLSLLCDPRAVRLVRGSLENHAGNSAVYAMEVLDLLVPGDIKALVLALLEDLAPAQHLRRLEPFTVPSRLDPRARLSAILHRERGTVSAWTQACAAQALGDMTQRDGQTAVPRDLVASLYHPDPVLQETAAAAIHGIDPAAYARHARHLPAAAQRRLDRIVGTGGAPALSAFARALFLRSTPPFATLAREPLLALGAAATERHLADGEPLPRTPGPAALHAVLAGELGGAGETASPGEILLTGPDTPEVRALAPSRILSLAGDPLLAALGRYVALAPALLRLAVQAPALT